MATTLGKYRLIAELGAGGMADVFLAVSTQQAGFVAKLVVIKRLKEHLATDVEFTTMFVDEARIAARLNHPNLVQTIEVGESDGHHFLTMEYLDGQPLNRVLNRARDHLPIEIFLSVLVDVLDGIHYAHELKDFDGTPLNIVHRDVTPQNIFIVYEGQVKVVDFGIAKAAGRMSETRHGIIKGKVAYMAPEQALGHPVDRRVDVFAVGLMIFEAVTRQRMWKGLKEREIIRRLVTGKIPTPKEVDPSVDDEINRICTQAIAYSPDARYPTAAALQEDLLAYLYKRGPRPTSRELGGFVANLFADKRTATSKVIEKQLALLRAESASAAASATSLPTLPVSVTDPERETASGALSVGPAAPVSNAPQDASTLVLDESSKQTQQPSRDRRWIVVALSAILLALAAAAVVVVVVLTSSAGSATPAPITVKLHATPVETRFSIDDGPLLENPFIGMYPRDGREHRVVAVAPGYTSKDESVVFESDVSIRFMLAAQASASASAAASSAAAASASASASAAPSVSTSASASAARKK